MPTINCKTARLTRGKHRSPDDGVCVVELASMIAGEPFSDRPKSVCRVIAALLRSYNDYVPDSRRQDLYRCAGDVVGTHADVATEDARLRHCLDVLDELTELRSRSLLWRLRSPEPARLEQLLETPGAAGRPIEMFLAGLAGVLHAGGRRGHARAMALVDELVAIRGGMCPASPLRADTIVRVAPAGRE